MSCWKRSLSANTRIAYGQRDLDPLPSAVWAMVETVTVIALAQKARRARPLLLGQQLRKALAERAAIQHAREKLEAIGPRLGAPHSSAIRGEDGSGLRELRPRAGRSRWRPIYRQVGPGTFCDPRRDPRGRDQARLR
jgi:hypothetical protein